MADQTRAFLQIDLGIDASNSAEFMAIVVP